jgi:hypothetical protein
MSDATPTPDAAPAPTPAQVAPAPETFSKDYVTELRNEAARYRTEKNAAVEAAKAATAAELQSTLADKDVALTEAQNQLALAGIELEKIYTALEAKIPSDKVRAFASLLKGEDKESIAESAKSAVELFGGVDVSAPAFDPTQGSGGNPVPLNGDPLLNMLKKVVGV